MAKVDDICVDGIPYPIVSLNRGVIVGGVLLGLLFNQPLITTLIFLIIAPAALFGRRASIVFKIGQKVFARQNEHAPKEDARMQRFNNIIATVMLGGAQLAFALGAVWAGWVLVTAVAFAALVALCGFCLGCFLYFQFNINRYRFARILAR